LTAARWVAKFSPAYEARDDETDPELSDRLPAGDAPRRRDGERHLDLRRRQADGHHRDRRVGGVHGSAEPARLRQSGGRRCIPWIEDALHFNVNVLHRDQARIAGHVRRPQAGGAALHPRLGQ
jgi:hypothetical protein